MKLYYDGKLIRTSKNHEYTHAVIDTETGSCLGCGTSLENAQAILNQNINEYETEINNCDLGLKAISENKTYYYPIVKGKSRKSDIILSAETYIRLMNEYESTLKRVKRHKVVELECRA